MITKWIAEPVLLEGETVMLIPLDKKYFNELIEVAKDKKIWEYYAFDGSNPNTMQGILHAALVERDNGNQFPFVIFHKADNAIIGSTRFLDIQPTHRKLEIGSTWLHPNYWATGVNRECKLLLLTYCFKHLKAIRVQLKTDENNLRSRKAIEKIGGQFEGILRHDMLRDNGTKRNSAYYSLLDEEWEVKKTDLINLCEKKKNNR